MSTRKIPFVKGDKIVKTAYLFTKDNCGNKIPYQIPSGAKIYCFFPNGVSVDTVATEVTFTANESKFIYTISTTKSANFVKSLVKQDIVFVVQEDGTSATEKTFKDKGVLVIEDRTI